MKYLLLLTILLGGCAPIYKCSPVKVVKTSCRDYAEIDCIKAIVNTGDYICNPEEIK